MVIAKSGRGSILPTVFVLVFALVLVLVFVLVGVIDEVKGRAVGGRNSRVRVGQYAPDCRYSQPLLVWGGSAK